MASPYKKAVRHALDCASRGLGVESCGYTSPTWRGVWLQAYQKAKQMDFPLDNFEDDITTAEDSINDNTQPVNKHLSETGTDEAAAGENGNAQPDNKGNVATTTHRQALGLFAGISNEDYHKGPGISSTSIKYAVKAMKLYHAHLTGVVSFEETEAMRLGTAVHALTLEALDFPNQIAVSKKFGTSTKAKEEKKEFYDAHPGKTIITADDYEHCQHMRDSLMALHDVQEIFKDGAPELSGYYIDRQTNMLCKYRPDWRADWCLFDIKSTVDISRHAFSAIINKFGYHVSADHYLEGDRMIEGTNHKQFVFGCVEPKPPYLAICRVLGQESLELGGLLRRQALDGIKHGRNTKEWPEYNNGITTEIEVPGYALNDLRLSKI